MHALGFKQPAHDFGRYRIGMMERRARVILQPLHAVLEIAIPPLVARLATDAANEAKLRHDSVALKQLPNELQSLLHGTGLLPAHGQVLLAHQLHLLPMCPE